MAQADAEKIGKTSLTLTLVSVVIACGLAWLSRWLLSVTLILGCGLFVAFEFALVKIPMRALERQVDQGRRGAATLLRMKEQMNAMLAACQFGITATSLGLTLALEPAIHHALAAYEQIAAYSAALAMFGGAFLHVTFGELVPKGLALVVPERVLYALAPFMQMFRWLAVPFIKTCNSIANVVVRVVSGHDPDGAGHHDESLDVREALVQAYSSGEIKPQQLTVMRNVLAISDRTIREAMTAARDVIVLDLDDPWERQLRIAEDSGFSRLPVYRGSPHDVIGYVRRADILSAEIRGKRELKPLVLPIERRPETALLGRINLFQGTPMVAVFDESDSFVGLLTAEDFVEQIVGEIYDDTDDIEGPGIHRLEDGSVRMHGKTLLSTAAEQLERPDLAEHAHEVDTVGGLILQRLGREPRPGDEVTLEGYTAHIEDSKGFRILSVLLVPRAPE